MLYQRLVAKLKRGEDRHLQAGMWAVAGVGLVHSALLLWVLLDAGLQPGQLAHDAVIGVMLGYQLFHSGLAVILTASQALRVRQGLVSSSLPLEPVVLRPFWIYTHVVFWLSFAAFVLLPMTWGAA